MIFYNGNLANWPTVIVGKGDVTNWPTTMLIGIALPTDITMGGGPC